MIGSESAARCLSVARGARNYKFAAIGVKAASANSLAARQSHSLIHSRQQLYMYILRTRVCILCNARWKRGERGQGRLNLFPVVHYTDYTMPTRLRAMQYYTVAARCVRYSAA